MERSTIVRVHEGLHARPATRFVKLAKGFESDIEIAKGGKSVSAKSSVKLMLLGVKELDEVTVRADGADAIEALEALVGYLENPRAGLDEAYAPSAAGKPAQDAPAAPAAASPQGRVEGQIKGVAASEGVALGRAFPFFRRKSFRKRAGSVHRRSMRKSPVSGRRSRPYSNAWTTRFPMAVLRKATVASSRR